MKKTLKPGPNERVFSIVLRVSDAGPSSSNVVEIEGETSGKSTPLGGRLGLSEVLRLAGNDVRQMFDTRQRKLLLEERQAEVARRREERKVQRVPKIAVPKIAAVPMTSIGGPLLESNSDELPDDSNGDAVRKLLGGSESRDPVGFPIGDHDMAELYQTHEPAAEPEIGPITEEHQQIADRIDCTCESDPLGRCTVHPENTTIHPPPQDSQEDSEPDWVKPKTKKEKVRKT